MAQSYTANGTSISRNGIPQLDISFIGFAISRSILVATVMRSGSVSGTPSERSVGRFGGIH
jgi:hypothetical protein